MSNQEAGHASEFVLLFRDDLYLKFLFEDSARSRRVRIGAPNQRLTPAAGVEAVDEADRVLGITAALDAGIGTVKERDRGVTGGELVMSVASPQLAGEDFLVGLDRRHADVAGQELEPVPTPASTTAHGIAKRFTLEHLAGIETGIGQVNTRLLDLIPLVHRTSLGRDFNPKNAYCGSGSEETSSAGGIGYLPLIMIGVIVIGGATAFLPGSRQSIRANEGISDDEG